MMHHHHDHHETTPPSLDLVSLQRPSSSSGLRPGTPRSALAATYSTYVVRVHTRHGIKTMSFDVLAAFFTYTAKKAAEDLGISSRTLIRVCRSLGIRRWPYLGFRSEKNVERIRQEAIENLRRKLERESSEATASCSSASSSSSASHHASASCLRGASAKRLLQMKLPSTQVGFPVPRGYERPAAFMPRPHGLRHPHCVHTVVSPSTHANHHHHVRPHHTQLTHSHGHPPTVPPLTPPPTHHAFDLEMRPSVSPRVLPHAHAAVTSFRKHHLATHFGQSPQEPSSPSTMPSLNVLMEASILTTFKHEVETHLAHPSESAMSVDTDAPHQARSMSMRDILSNTAMTA